MAANSRILTPRLPTRWGWCVAGFIVALARPLCAQSDISTAESELAERTRAPGPTVILDKLEFPVMLGASKYEQHLRKVLRKEVAAADWGASKDSTIEYRFAVTSLTVQQKDDVLLVKCTATGTLPRGRRAQSQLSFGGSPRQHGELIRRVLAIVAHGVVTRLAEIERVRRGKQREAQVIPPADTLL
jgi:hypothetical protein